MSQTSGYSENMELGVAGQRADTMKFDAASLQNSESSGVPFGTAVVDKKDGTFEQFDAITKKLRGVLMHAHAYDNDDLDPAGVPTKQLGDVMTRGRIVVTPEEAVSDGDEAFVRYAGTGTKGAFRKSYVTDEATHLPKARFRSDAEADKPAVLELLDGAGEPDAVQLQKDVAALTATTTIELGAVPQDRHVKVRSASLSIGEAAGDDTDHWVFEIRAGSTVLASWDTDTAVDGAIVQNTPSAMNVQDAAGQSLERLTFVATKNGTASDTTAGALAVELEVY